VALLAGQFMKGFHFLSFYGQVIYMILKARKAYTVPSNKSSNIVHNSGTNPGIWVVVLVEITDCATTGKARNGCIRATEL
jgi:hypothetical protein